MCGICGIFSFDGHPINTKQLHIMMAALKHRGPDGSGAFTLNEVGLGHRRLSIIDLEGGGQPLSNEDTSIHLVFNGEIYNFVELREELQKAGHQFKTHSDTEVIVHGYEEWGLDCVRHFNGIFAFAIWDAAKRQLFLARDHLGVKPLYYATVAGKLIFASEIKALTLDKDCPRDVDVTALGQLFTFRYVPAPRTLFKGISKLPAGHFMVVDRKGTRIERFWGGVPTHRLNCKEGQLLEEYRYLLEDAVRLQLRSDVPVGLFLSSGIDSGAILALMRKQLNGKIHTFTIGFEGGERTNETDDARELARMFDAEHCEMIVRAEDYLTYYERYMYDLEEPLGNESAAAFFFVSMLASKHVKVVLTGQGADEPWAGYPRHLGVKLSEYYLRLPRPLTNDLMKRVVSLLPDNEKLRRGVVSLDEADLLTRFEKIYAYFSPAMKSQLFQGWVKDEWTSQQCEAKDALAHLQGAAKGLDPVSQMLYIDTRASLPDDLLMVNDKLSMANSIEARVPLLDYRLVEFAESLPPEYKLKLFTAKYLHKRAVEKWLPKTVVYRKKKGFDNPMHKWLRGRLRSVLEENLFGSDSCIRDYFDVTYVRELVRMHYAGERNYMRQIHLLNSFEMWHRRFMRGP